jgi:hypothetical protein
VDWPGTLATSEEADIETSEGPGAPVHRTTVWPVVEGGDVYVRSLNGEAGRWYREALANPDVVLHVGGVALPARAVHTPDPDSIAAASAGLQRKYADSPYLESMIRDEILEATLRFEPR